MIWRCIIGGDDGARPLPEDADLLLRMAVEDAYRRLTGEAAAFVFSGWGVELTDAQRAVLEGERERAQRR